MLFLIRLLLARTIFHPLEGLTWRLRRKIFREEKYQFSWRYWPKIALITIQSGWQTYLSHRAAEKFGLQIVQSKVDAPIFILGHYRSGTTHLHELLSIDPQFASPNRFQAYHPGSFLVTERWFKSISDLFMLPRRVQEDEIGLMNLSGLSPYMDWCFPENSVDYSQYLTFRRASLEEALAWKQTLRWYLGALTVRYGRPILLKSPPHTARIRLILDTFPDARFIHIRRNPFDVFVSTVKLLHDLDPVFRLRLRKHHNTEEYILKTYQEMYNAFLDDVELIPEGQLSEVTYEDLEISPVHQLSKIYRDLRLDGFDHAKPAIEAYLESIKSYQKNRHPKIDPTTRSQIVERWSRVFSAWNYPLK